MHASRRRPIGLGPPAWLHVPSLGVRSTEEACARDADGSIGCPRRYFEGEDAQLGHRACLSSRRAVESLQPRALPKRAGCACFEDSMRRAPSEWPVPPSAGWPSAA